MKLFKKKKVYDFGDFQSDDPNDFSIAKHYYKENQYLKEQNYKLFRENMRLKEELNLHGGKMIITKLEVRDI